MSTENPTRIETLIADLLKLADFLNNIHPDDLMADILSLHGLGPNSLFPPNGLTNIKLTRADILEHLMKHYPEYYGPLPSHLYEINSKAMQALKEQMVAHTKHYHPKGQPYSKTSAGGFYSAGYSENGDQFDLPMEVFRVKSEDVIAYLADWLMCNGGHSKFQFNLAQAQRHEELINVMGNDPTGDDVAFARTGNLYVADVSGRQSWLYKTPFFMHTHIGRRQQDTAQMIEDLHEFYDQVFAERGLKMRIIYIEDL